MKLQHQTDMRVYTFEVMLCFWFALYKETLYETQLLYTLDPICAQIMKNLREKGEDAIKEKREREANQKKRRDMFSISNLSASALDASGVNASNEISKDNMEDEDPFGDGEHHHHRHSATPEKEIEEVSYNVTSIEDIKEIKWLL